jgi:hypothetical protein
LKNEVKTVKPFEGNTVPRPDYNRARCRDYPFKGVLFSFLEMKSGSASHPSTLGEDDDIVHSGMKMLG